MQKILIYCYFTWRQSLLTKKVSLVAQTRLLYWCCTSVTEIVETTLIVSRVCFLKFGFWLSQLRVIILTGTQILKVVSRISNWSQFCFSFFIVLAEKMDISTNVEWQMFKLKIWMFKMRTTVRYNVSFQGETSIAKNLQMLFNGWGVSNPILLQVLWSTNKKVSFWFIFVHCKIVCWIAA